MIDTDTMYFMKMLDELSAKRNIGFKSFETTSIDDLLEYQGIIYTPRCRGTGGDCYNYLQGDYIVRSVSEVNARRNAPEVYGSPRDDFAVRCLRDCDGTHRVIVTVIHNMTKILVDATGWRFES